MATSESDVEGFLKLCRLLEIKRQQFLKDDWEKNIKNLSRSQYFHLMVIRSFLPCNLNTIVTATGLTSAGASIYVDNLVQLKILKRELATHDRRHIVISLTSSGENMLQKIDERLNKFVSESFIDCTEADCRTVAEAIKIINHHLAD